MGWFDEQIRQRKLSDQEVFEESIFRMASVVLGRQRAGVLNEEHIVTKAAIDEILKYFHYKPAEIPDSVKDPDEQLEFCLRPHGIMRRNVRLEEGWYKDSFGPLLAFLKNDETPVALLPKPFMGYWFINPENGKKTTLNGSNAKMFDEDAICFYRPLPLKKLGIPDLIVYMKNCLNTGDYVSLIALTLIGTLFGMLMTGITRALTGFVLDSGSAELLIGTAAFMVCAIISSQLTGAIRSLMMNRIEIKTSLSVEAAMMMRVMNLPANFFRKYSSGELSSRYSAVNQLCSLLLGSVFSTGLTSLMSLLYITQIFHYAPALVAPALVIILVSVSISALSTITQMRVNRQIMEQSAKESGLSFALINGVQKIKLAGAEKRAFSRWAKAYSDAAEPIYNPPVFIKANTAITSAISLAGTILIYYLAVQTRVSPSEYIAFNAAYGAVTGAFASLTGVALSIARIKPILEMAEPILKTEPESAEKK